MDPFAAMDKDMQLLFDNARRYNDPGSQVIEDTRVFGLVYQEEKKLGLLRLTGCGESDNCHSEISQRISGLSK
jgi:hypothetical protein